MERKGQCIGGFMQSMRLDKSGLRLSGVRQLSGALHLRVPGLPRVDRMFVLHRAWSCNGRLVRD